MAAAAAESPVHMHAATHTTLFCVKVKATAALSTVSQGGNAHATTAEALNAGAAPCCKKH
jgi:hypothetical protein